MYVAMSGGVDSSVAAALLKKQGYNITGVFFKPWTPEKGLVFCNWQKERRDAMAVASVLGIPFKTWDFSKDYKKWVGDYMINSYRNGLTPNPDVMCNKEIKFGLFLKKALAEGADFIATGHYVRLKPHNTNLQIRANATNNSWHSHGIRRFALHKAKDKNKDQSYFLWTLSQDQLKHCLFPIGSYLKSEVRKMAKKFKLPTYDKKDSQGVCFIGQLDMKEFLKKYVPSKQGGVVLIGEGEQFLRAPSRQKLRSPKPLEKVIGIHDGAAYYTIGQRHGLNITNGGGPYFVIKKDMRKNIVYVAKDQKELSGNEFKIQKVSWINQPAGSAKNLSVKIRYRTQALPVASLKSSGSGFTVKLKKPARAIAAGQSAVFYRGQEIIGGGIIT